MKRYTLENRKFSGDSSTSSGGNTISSQETGQISPRRRRDFSSLLERRQESLETVTEDEGSDDVVDELPEFPPSRKMNIQRHSVSAEAYGAWNKKSDFKPPSYVKTPEQESRIKEVVSQAFMFQHLDDADLKTVIEAFQERHIPDKETFIKQGEDGSELFLIESGEVDVYKSAAPDAESAHVTVMKPGDTVGELALLYNTPRAATCVAKGPLVLWALDRRSFNHIVRDAATRKRDLYETFLKEVPILSTMDPYERSKIGDALKTQDFADGEEIITQGQPGDSFYIIVKGNADAVKDGTVVYQYERGDYFGELALIRNQPRAATVVARGPVQCISLDRRSFKRLLGPIEDILRRQAGKYEQIEGNLRNAR